MLIVYILFGIYNFSILKESDAGNPSNSRTIFEWSGEKWRNTVSKVFKILAICLDLNISTNI